MISMERKRAYIHIGLVKTGTKSIQFVLAQHRYRLARAGWLFPKEGTTTNRSGHHGLAWHLQNADNHHPALRDFRLESFTDAVAAAGGQNIIISSEELSVLSSDRSAIQSLLDLFPGREVLVVAYVREQAELLNSLYAQTLTNLRYPGSIGEFVAEALERDAFNYHMMFQHWSHVLGDRLLIRPYDHTQLVGGDVVKDLAHLLDLDEVMRPLATGYKNKQPNSMQVAVLVGLAQRLAGFRWELYSDRHRYLRKIASEILEDPELTSSREPYWGIGPAWTERVREHYSQSNSAFFSQIVGNSFAFSGIGRRRNALTYMDLSPAMRARITARLQAALVHAP